MRLLLFFFLISPQLLFSQDNECYFEYQVEVVEDLPGFLGEEGYVTYRFYIGNLSPTDRISALYGVNIDEGEDILLRSTTEIFQHPNGGYSSNQLNCALFETFPLLEFDSYVTLGMSTNCDAGSYLVLVLDPLDALATFESGDSLFIEDGLLFAVGDVENSFGDENDRILLAQVTTQGIVSVCLNTDMFPDGNGDNQVFVTTCIDHIIGGCLDEDACNYSALATIEDGSCISRADLDHSGNIDILDLLELLSVFGSPSTCEGDLNADTLINVSDLLMLLGLVMT